MPIRHPSCPSEVSRSSYPKAWQQPDMYFLWKGNALTEFLPECLRGLPDQYRHCLKKRELQRRKEMLQGTIFSNSYRVHLIFCKSNKINHKKKNRLNEPVRLYDCNLRLLFLLLSLNLLCNIVHDRSCDEDRSISSDNDTHDERYCKTSDNLATEDCDCKHCDESCE